MFDKLAAVEARYVELERLLRLGERRDRRHRIQLARRRVDLLTASGRGEREDGEMSHHEAMTPPATAVGTAITRCRLVLLLDRVRNPTAIGPRSIC